MLLSNPGVGTVEPSGVSKLKFHPFRYAHVLGIFHVNMIYVLYLMISVVGVPGDLTSCLFSQFIILVHLGLWILLRFFVAVILFPSSLMDQKGQMAADQPLGT
jgi:hypothetical protein